jgi:putative transcriptional regulator
MSSNNDSLSLHNRLAVFRAERGLSRAALAELVSVNPQTIGFLERGQYGPSLELGLKLAAVFGVPVETLFSLEPFTPLATSLAAQRTLEGDQ